MGVAAACVENRCGRIFRRGTVGARPSKPVYLPPVEFSRDNRIYFVSYRNFTSPESSRRTRSHAILVPRIAEIYLYDPLKVPLPREINSYVFEYIFILSSPSFFPRSFFFLSNASSFIKPSFHSTRINASSSRRASEEFLDRFSADPLHPAPPLFFLGRCRSTGLTRGLGMRDKPSNVNRGILVRG